MFELGQFLLQKLFQFLVSGLKLSYLGVFVEEDPHFNVALTIDPSCSRF